MHDALTYNSEYRAQELLADPPATSAVTPWLCCAAHETGYSIIDVDAVVDEFALNEFCLGRSLEMSFSAMQLVKKFNSEIIISKQLINFERKY